MRRRSVALAVVAVSVTLALTACGRTPTHPASGDPAQNQTSPSTGVPAFVSGLAGPVSGTPPNDPNAVTLARDWVASAVPPPGVRTLGAPPPSSPSAPATTPACDWLVEATKWWSTDRAHLTEASTWLTQHPVQGLAADGTMTGPGENSAIVEHAPQKPDDSIEFEFVPEGDTVTIRVDVIVVPTGAKCASAGGAQTGPANSVGR
ncbi:hypothetical protein [Leifsonia sp. EB34]|uniref:hypothetical protein n=1 Tax=Leifsonia sp. EB34 TaxID=3156303 RepID=UPI003518416C